MPYQYMPGYQPMYYQPPMPDQLAQLRGSQFQPMQPQMPQAQPQQAGNPMPSSVDDRIWVQGENAATAYLVAANGFVRLWDSTAPVFYEKRADAQGKPFPIVAYDYKRRGEDFSAPQATPVEYATKQDLDALAARVEALATKKQTTKKSDTKEDAE